MAHSDDARTLYIDGRWSSAGDGATFAIIDPSDGSEVGVAAEGASQTPEAIGAARAALRDWADRTATERYDLLRQAHDAILADLDGIANVVTRETGKPLEQARGEVRTGAAFLLWNGEEAKRVYGRTVPAPTRDKRVLVLKQPIGVVGAITPWNFPFSLLTRKIAPALAAGCPVVVRPAEETPLSAVALFRVLDRVGFPSGVINLITGTDAAGYAHHLMESPDVRKITFTGSTEVGKLLFRGAADTVKALSLELGGHAPFLIFADADIDAAVQGVIDAKFLNAGQTCVCANRILVEASIAGDVTKRLAEATRALRVGPGSSPGTDIGPLINQAAVEKVSRQVEDATTKGATIVVGGSPATRRELSRGFFFEPTVLADVTRDMTIATEETFGPVVPVLPFEAEDDALEAANDTEYGLAAYCYTQALSRALRVAEGLQYGIVGLNDVRPVSPQAPFGGVKQSGIGRENGAEGISDYLETKTVSIGIV